MPTSTFYNLEEDKRNKILNAAINEFATHPYPKSSINRIVQKAEIAKGSFYQYFDSKEDLFEYIVLDVIRSKKLEYLNHIIDKIDNLNFFQILRQIYLGGIKFGQENPKLQSIGARFMKMSNNEFKEEILGDTSDMSSQFLQELLAKGIERGEVNSKIDIELVAYILTHFNLSAAEYFFNEAEIKEEKEIVSWDEHEAISIIDQVLYLIENGIKNNN